MAGVSFPNSASCVYVIQVFGLLLQAGVLLWLILNEDYYANVEEGHKTTNANATITIDDERDIQIQAHILLVALIYKSFRGAFCATCYLTRPNERHCLDQAVCFVSCPFFLILRIHKRAETAQIHKIRCFFSLTLKRQRAAPCALKYLCGSGGVIPAVLSLVFLIL